MTPEDSRTQTTEFVICVNDPIVSEDIARTLFEEFPGAKLCQADSLEEAERYVLASSGIMVAFLHMGPAQLAKTPLGQALAGSHAKVILMGDDAENSEIAEGFQVLQRPFRTVDLLMLLDSLALQR